MITRKSILTCSRNLVSFFAIAFLFVTTGCTLGVKMGTPAISSFHYAEFPSQAVTITVVDKRSGNIRFFSGRMGVMKDNTYLENVTDELTLFANTLEKELRARGMNVTVQKGTDGSGGDIVVTVSRFNMQYHQPTAYNPFTVFTFFKAEARKGKETHALVSYYVTGRGIPTRVKTGITMVLTESLEVIVKDIASKINQRFFRLEAEKSHVERLIKAAEKEELPTCESILEIAFTNSRHAVPFLTKLNDDIERGRAKACAISALGFHGDPTFLPFLEKFAVDSARKERLSAFGAIGSIGTPEALKFLKTQKSDDIQSTYVRFTNAIIELFTE